MRDGVGDEMFNKLGRPLIDEGVGEIPAVCEKS